MEVYNTKAKFKRKKHTRIRYYDRTTMLHSIEHIRQQILKKENFSVNVFWAKRLTHTKSLVYVVLDNIAYKCIWSRDKKIIVTFLKLKYDFKFEHLLFYHDSAYNVTIYPDCFNDVQRKETLTKIIDVVHNTQIFYNHPDFENIFNIVLDIYNEEKENMGKQYEKIKIKN